MWDRSIECRPFRMCLNLSLKQVDIIMDQHIQKPHDNCISKPMISTQKCRRKEHKHTIQ